MLGLCCRKDECCEEKLEDALSRLSFDEIKHLIHAESRYMDERIGSATVSANGAIESPRSQPCDPDSMTSGGEPGGSSISTWCCSSDEQGLGSSFTSSGPPVDALAVALPTATSGAELMSGSPSQVGHLPSKVSSWRRKQLQARLYLREEAPLNDRCDITYSSDKGINSKDLQVFETHAFAGASSESPPESISSVNRRALETAAAATVYACGAMRTSSREASTPRSPHRLHNGRTPSASRDISRTETTDLMEVVGPTPSCDISKDGWSVCSDDAPPGGCTRSSETPAMGALVIEHGYKFDSGGFHEVGTLDTLDEALDLTGIVDLDDVAQQISLRKHRGPTHA